MKEAAMEQPIQSTPVERLYMRLVVGRKGRLDQLADNSELEDKPSRRKQRKRVPASSSNYLVELTTFHVSRRWLRGRR